MRGLILVLLVSLAACVGGPITPSAPLGKAQLAAAGDDGGEITSATGDRLAYSVWRPDQPPRALILALHGFGDYGPSTFAGPAAYWAEQGFLTYAYDQRGFGRNASRGQWPGAARLVDDFGDVVAALRAAHPDLPLFVIGHSMGGAVAITGVQAGQAEGLILAAPAVWGGDRLALPYRAAAWAGALVLPEKRWTGDGIVRIQASDNIEMLRALGRDPVYLHRPSSREFMGLIRLMDNAVSAAPHLAVPVLMLYGDKDEVAPKDAVLAAYDAVPGDKTLIVYPEGWHLLFRDLQARRVWKDVAGWIEGRIE